MKGRNITILISSVVAVGGISFFVYNRFRKKGMIASIEKQIADYKSTGQAGSGANTTDVVSGIGTAAWNRSALSVKKVIEYGDKIRKAKGTFKDSDDVVYSTIVKLTNKVQLSQIDTYVQDLNGGVALIPWLEQWMDTKDPSGELYLDKVKEYISKLPKTL